MSKILTTGVVSNTRKSGYILYTYGTRQFFQFGDGISMFQTTPFKLDSNYLSVGYGRQNDGGTVLAVKTDGTLWGWGNASGNRMTAQYSGTQYSPVQIGTGSNWKYVSTGVATHALIDNNDKLWVMGASFAQIGTDNWKTIKEVNGYRIGIMSDDTMWGWGTNAAGQLGQNNTITYTSPVLIGSGSTWKTFDVSGHVMAIRSDNTLWTWGSNASGQLGIGNVISRSSPVQVGTGSNWASASCSEFHSVLIDTSGRLYTCGRATEGQLGIPFSPSRSSPVQVGTSTDWNIPIAGWLTSFAVKNNGTLWAWGSNSRNSTGFWSLVFGNGSFAGTNSPVQVGTGSNWTRNFHSGQGSTTVIDSINDLYTWGSNQSGNVGLPNTFCSSIVQISNEKWTKVVGGKNTSTVIPPAIFARKSNKTLWSWGALDSFGTGFRSSPVQIGSKTDWTNEFDVGGNIGAAIDESGRLYSLSGTAATQVGSLTNWRTLSVGQINGNGDGPHYTATKIDGTLWTWGRNDVGQLGNNSVVTTASPVQLGPDTNWRITFGGQARTFAIKTDGTLWGWGLNTTGELGLGNVANRSSPVQIGTDTDWSIVSHNQLHTLAIKTNGTLWGWGFNATGELGLGNVANRSSPVQIGTDTDWVDIATSVRYSFAVKSNGTLWNWGAIMNNPAVGANINGTFESVNRSSPVQVGTDINWKFAVAGGHRVGFFLKQ
jgi:alpha-tubulin suppressor-like RCC1 family protein